MYGRRRFTTEAKKFIAEARGFTTEAREFIAEKRKFTTEAQRTQRGKKMD